MPTPIKRNRQTPLTEDETYRDHYLRFKTGCLINLVVILFVYAFTYILRFQGLFNSRLSPGNLVMSASLGYIILFWALNEYVYRSRIYSLQFRINIIHALGIALYVCNLFAITALIHFTGGVNSLFPVIYVLLAMYASFMGRLPAIVLLASFGVILHGILLWLEYQGSLPSYHSELFILSEEISPDKAAIIVFTLFSTMTFLFQYLGRRFHRVYESQREELVDHRTNLERLVEKRTQDLTSALEELRSTYDSLEREKRGQENFLAHVTHQFRTPIHIINNFVSNFLNGVYGDVTSSQIEALHHLSMSSQNLLNLINNLLDMAKIKSGKMEFQAETCFIRETLEKIIAVMKPLSEGRGVPLHLEMAPGVPERIETDPVKLESILMNLIHNAVKFSKKRPVHLRVLRSSGEGDLIFQVEDSGKGIPREHQERIFEAFEQIHGPQEPRGSGLGLYICRTFARIIGGELLVSSEPGQGTTFELSLPIEKRESATAGMNE